MVAMVKVRKPKKMADGGVIDKIKSVVGLSGTPTISGGMSDAIKRREERMAAVERGEPDPGQKREEPVKKADGGKIKKGLPTPATKPKAVARNHSAMAGNAKGSTMHLKNGGKVKGY
jgi:hypothetical protein